MLSRFRRPVSRSSPQKAMVSGSARNLDPVRDRAARPPISRPPGAHPERTYRNVPESSALRRGICDPHLAGGHATSGLNGQVPLRAFRNVEEPDHPFHVAYLNQRV
jgi:hypothetical protein